MNLQSITDAIGTEGLILMVVCFVAVVWWGFRKPKTGSGDDDPPWPGEEGP